MLFAPYVRFRILSWDGFVTSYWEIAAHSAYDTFSLYCVNLGSSRLGIGVGVSFL